MDCKNCVSALVCKDAQDSSYRERFGRERLVAVTFIPDRMTH